MKKQKVPKLLIVLLVVLLLVFVVSAVMVITQLVRDQHEDSAFEELASRVHQASSESTELVEPAWSVGEGSAAANDLDSSSSDAQQPSGETSPSVSEGSGSVGEQGVATSDTQQAPSSIIQPPAVDGLDSSSSDPQQPSGETAPSDARQTSHPIIQPAGNAAESVREERMPLPMYAELLSENPDLFGWISIDDTKIDYPVMHTPSDPQYYLHRAFDHSYSYSGTPFLSGECYEGCGNYIVYGHHMKNQTMFGSLSRYASRSYWEQHPVIRFDTVYATGNYEVVAAFNARVYGDGERDVFRYYDYTDLTEEARFDEFMTGVHAAQMYDTGVKVNFGDELLTLITCNYQVEDGRFVVVARKIL